MPAVTIDTATLALRLPLVFATSLGEIHNGAGFMLPEAPTNSICDLAQAAWPRRSTLAPMAFKAFWIGRQQRGRRCR